MNSFFSFFLEEKVFTNVKTENRVRIKSFEKTGKINCKRNQFGIWIINLKHLSISLGPSINNVDNFLHF